MFLTKLKTTVAVVLALSVIGSAGVCTYYLRGQGSEPGQFEFKLPEKITPDKVAPAKTAEALQKLLKERRDSAEEEMKTRHEQFQTHGLRDDHLRLMIDSSRRLLKAELELSTKKADRLVAHERHVRLMKQAAKLVKEKYEAARVSKADLAQAEYERLDAEIALEREKAR